MADDDYYAVTSPYMMGLDLIHATKSGDLELVQILLGRGVNPCYQDWNDFGRTPLHNLVLFDYLEVCQYLVRHCRNAPQVLNARDHSGRTALHEACSCDETDSLEIAKFLLENGAHINVQTNEGKTPLHLACEHELFGAAKLLLEMGANLDLPTFDGVTTPFRWACEQGKPVVAKFLLEHGVNLHHHHNQTTTTTNATSTTTSTVKTMFGAQVHDNSNKTGKTFLHVACMNGHLEIAKLLLKNDDGAAAVDIEEGTFDGYQKTPLYLACEHDQSDMVDFLLCRGANPSAKTAQGSTPLQVACQESHANVIWVLIHHYPSLIVELSD